jgi:hypothetical protein
MKQIIFVLILVGFSSGALFKELGTTQTAIYKTVSK